MDSKLEAVKTWLREYDGPEVSVMEVCGSHTAAISQLGIPFLLSPHIHLLSGPGCPVCVTPTAYIDRLIDLSLTPGCCVCTFGDLIRVPGSNGRSLAQARAEDGRVKMAYSPMSVVEWAKHDPQTTFYFAAVGFETTAPVYALLMETLTREHIQNVKLLTALKTMPPVLDALCRSGAKIDGFLAPGHVSVVTGSCIFEPLAERWQKPFVIAGFQGGELLAAIYTAVRSRGQGVVRNLYPRVVTAEGNLEAQRLVSKYFEPASAVWRGMGAVDGSGLLLREEWSAYDGGSADLNADHPARGCCCGAVLSGKLNSTECPLFAKKCTPQTPQGACMVSMEGSCRQAFLHSGGRVFDPSVTAVPCQLP